MITDKTSKQWELLRNVYFDENGICMIDGYYCVALGSHFGDIGDKYRITLEDGSVLHVIKADEKADKDVVNGVHHACNNSISEFLVNTDMLNRDIMYHGDVNVMDGFDGKIIKIEREI